MTESGTNYTRGLPAVTTVTALPILTFFLFGPLAIFDGNRQEFESGFADWLLVVLPTGTLTWAALAVAGMLLKGAWRDRYLWLILALGCLIWAQSAFLVHDYGNLDGRGLDWQPLSGPAGLDLVLWIALPWLMLANRHRLGGTLTTIATVVLAVQLLAAAQSLVDFDQKDWTGDPDSLEEPPQSLFEYSNKRNVVHIVLDNFQTDVFEQIVEEEGLASAFDGFILFRENAAAAPYTNLAIPSILLGRSFDGKIPDSRFHQKAAQDGLPSRLHDLGYRVNLSLMMSLEGARHSAAFRIPDSLDETPQARARAEALQVLDVMLFRAVPHLTRKWVYNDNNWRLGKLFGNADGRAKAFTHRQYLRDYAERIRVVDSAPAYHFIHVWPPHPPYVTEANGAPAGEALPNTRENYKNEARATVYALIEVLDALRQHELYDNSLIIVQSDHGGAFEPEFTPTRMLALLAAKRHGSRGALRVSQAQTSVTDAAATILSESGLPDDGPGRSVFEISESETRSRSYAMYHGKRDDTLQVVQIEGSLYSPESYNYLEPQPLAVHRPVYRYGNIANVGLEGEATGYLGEGWSTPFPNIVWNNGREATLEIPIEPTPHPLSLEFWLIPSIHGEDWPRQRFTLRIGETEIERWTLTERASTKLETVVPAGFANTDELVLTLEFQDAVRQRDLGVGQDRRLQAVALSRFRLRKAKPESD